SGTYFLRDAERLLERETLLHIEPLAERPARDERLHVVQHPVRLTRVDERHDMRVRQSSGDPDLAEESLGAERGGEAGPEHLDRDLAPVLPVLGQVDGRPAAATKLSLDRISVSESGGERSQRLRHGQWSGWDSNPRPPGCKPGALPAELPPRSSFKITPFQTATTDHVAFSPSNVAET